MKTDSDTVIRPATLQDLPRILEIYAWYVRHTAITFEWDVPTEEAFAARMETTMKMYPYFVAETGGIVTGYAYTGPFKGRKAYDWSAETSVYLQHDLRGRGIGRRLYAALEEASRRQGITNLYACISAPRHQDPYLDDASIRFHERMDYRLCGRFEKCGCKFGRWYDMVWMEKLVGPHRPDPAPVIPYRQTGSE